jgi:hypothetical protein
MRMRRQKPDGHSACGHVLAYHGRDYTSELNENGWRLRIEGWRTSRGVGKRRCGWLADPNRWNVDGAEQASRNCGTRPTVVAAGTSPNHPWHRQDMAAGRPAPLSDGEGCRCEPAEASSFIEMATDQERCDQRKSWKPDHEEKTQVRPVAAHYR